MRTAVVFLNLAIVWGAGATSVVPFTIQKLSQKSQAVVHGRVVAVESKNSKRYAQVEVLEHVRGVAIPARLEVALLQKGSRAAGWIERVPDAMELRAGEEVLMFLNRSRSDGRWVPVGLQQGKYRVLVDRQGVRRALSWKQGAINRVSDADILGTPSRTARALSAADSGLSEKELEKSQPLSALISEIQGFAQ